MKESPLFWPVTFKQDTIYCLDETALPNKLVYRKAHTVSSAVKLIKDMKTRAFGQVLRESFFARPDHLFAPKGVRHMRAAERFLRFSADVVDADVDARRAQLIDDETGTPPAAFAKVL